MVQQLQKAIWSVVCLLTLGYPSATLQAQAPTDLFFSEYVEGTSNNKALEVYNGTGSTIDLAAGQYVIQFYFNGETRSRADIFLLGRLMAGDVFVLADKDADPAILRQADQTSEASFFNGNDAIVLRKGGTSGPILDVIGQVGNDPGMQWGSGLTSTADNTLRRKATVCGGDTNSDDSFLPATQWDGYSVDTFGGLGSHTATCNGTPPLPATPLALTLTATPTRLLTTALTTLSATVSGGTAPYSYTFSGPGTIRSSGGSATVEGLAAGIHRFTVLVRDQTSPTSQTISSTVSVTAVEPITPPSPTTPLTLTLTAIPARLLTTSTTPITLSAIVLGGTLPYSYSFSGPGVIKPTESSATVSGLTAGIHRFTVLVQDQTTPTSQTLTDTVSVTVDEPMTARLSGSTTVCSGNLASLGLAVSGGTAPYRAVISNGSSTSVLVNLTNQSTFTVAPALSTTYAVVSVLDNAGTSVTNVSGFAEVIVRQVTASIVGAQTVCSGQTTSLTASGGTSYRWSTGVTTSTIVAGAGSYSVIVSDALQCTATVSQVVSPQPAVPTPQLVTQGGASSIAVGQSSQGISLFVVGCLGSPSWSGPASISGNTSSIPVPTNLPGSYTYAAICRVNGCASSPANAIVQVTAPVILALNERADAHLQVTILENPVAGNEVTVRVTGAEGQAIRFQLLDLSGRLIAEQYIDHATASQHQTLSVGNRENQFLLLRVSTPTQSVTHKLLQL